MAQGHLIRARVLYLPVCILGVWMFLGMGCGPSECVGGDCGEFRTTVAGSASQSTDKVDGGGGADAGTSRDAGGGVDAGVSCLNTAHDPQLGTLKLQPGFASVGAVALPPGLLSLTAVSSNKDFKLYGVRGSDKSLYSLGTWPQVAWASSALMYVVDPVDRSRVTILSDFLVNDGRRLLTGYIRGGSGGDGKVLVYDVAAPSSSRYLSAPGNTSAAALEASTSAGDTALFVSGTGLNELGSPGDIDNAAIYALKTQSSPARAVRLALFAPEWVAVNGRSAMTSSGVAVFGYLSAMDDQAHLRAVPHSIQDQALMEETPFSLADWPEIYSGPPEGLLIAGFGEGLAVHRALLAAGDLRTLDVLRIPLAPGSSSTPSVRVGTPVPVLVSKDLCTRVTRLAPIGRDLLVGVSDKNGERLVRLKEQPK